VADVRKRAGPKPAQALNEPLRGFPSWFLRIECDRCGKVRWLNEAHATKAQHRVLLRDLLARARHDGCGGRAARAKLLSGTEGVSGLNGCERRKYQG
jgi:hypothetical protein